MNRFGPYREAVVVAVCAMVVWLLLLPGGRHSQEFGLLFSEAPQLITIISNDETIHLDLAHEPAVIRDAANAVIGRMWPREARAIHEAFEHCQLLTVNAVSSLSAEQRQQYGLDHGVAIEVNGRSLRLGSSGLDRGYAIDGNQWLLLDTDLAALIARPVAALRDPSLDVGQPQRMTASAGWHVERDAGRWWLTTENRDHQWTDQTVMDLWIDALVDDSIIGFAQAPEQEHLRATLTILTSDNHLITLDDLGPAAGGGRLLRRTQAGSHDHIVEYIISSLDPIFLAPQPNALVPRQLIPLDLSQADSITIGAHQFTRDGQSWQVDGHNDVDQTAILAWMEALAAMPRSQLAPDTPALAVTLDHLEFTLPRSTPSVAALVTPTRLLSLRLRQVVPDLEAEAITALVLQERQGAPTIFNREPGTAWPTGDQEVAEAFTAALLQAEVQRWTATTSAQTTTDTSHTVTIATGAGTTVIHLNDDGTVIVPQRGLRGILTARSRRALLGR